MSLDKIEDAFACLKVVEEFLKKKNITSIEISPDLSQLKADGYNPVGFSWDEATAIVFIRHLVNELIFLPPEDNNSEISETISRDRNNKKYFAHFLTLLENAQIFSEEIGEAIENKVEVINEAFSLKFVLIDQDRSFSRELAQEIIYFPAIETLILAKYGDN